MKRPIISLIGSDGTGKTKQAMSFPDGAKEGKRIIFFDFEDKAEETQENIYPDASIEIIKMFSYNLDPKEGKIGKKNTIKTIELIEKNLNYFTENYNDVSYFVLDGVSGIREMYTEKWIRDNPIYDKETKRTIPRKGILKENLGAWKDINTNVKDLIGSFIGLCKMTNKMLIITVKEKDEYKNVEISGELQSIKMPDKVPDVKDFLFYDVSIKIQLIQKNGKFFARYMRAPIKQLPDQQNITGISLYENMQNLGLIE